MSSIEQKFARLSTDNAPGQEVRQRGEGLDAMLKGENLPGTPVDFFPRRCERKRVRPHARLP